MYKAEAEGRSAPRDFQYRYLEWTRFVRYPPAMALIEDEEGIARVVKQSRRIAVLGMKTEARRSAPAFYVPAYLHEAGLEIVPVPVYYPDATELLGLPVYRKLADVPGELDLVNVFRRPDDIDQHVEDILACKPKAVWFQLGIRNQTAAGRLSLAGIDVVQDRCLLVEYRRLARG